MLERAVRSKSAAGGEQILLGKDAAERTAGLQKLQEGWMLGRTCQSTSSALEVAAG